MATPEEQKVIEAAKQWHAVWKEPSQKWDGGDAAQRLAAAYEALNATRTRVSAEVFEEATLVQPAQDAGEWRVFVKAGYRTYVSGPDEQISESLLTWLSGCGYSEVDQSTPKGRSAVADLRKQLGRGE